MRGRMVFTAARRARTVARMFRKARRDDCPRFLVLVMLATFASAGCNTEPEIGGPPPTVMAGVTILNLHSNNPDPASFATCQTGAAVLLEAHGSFDPAGQPLEFEWRDEVDYGDGVRIAAPDWGPNAHVRRTTAYEIPAQFSTVAYHYLTLTVRTRDGRSANHTLRMTVTSCESCGIP